MACAICNVFNPSHRANADACPSRAPYSCIYTSTLSYVVDANNGRSSSAVATNSAFRGGTAFIAAELAVPLQNAIGDGGMYSLWAGLILLSELLILLVWWKGGAWRAKWELKEQGVRGP